MKKVLSKKEKDFVRAVWKHYKTNGRQNLPWRKTKNPYRILVSEVMLQQTQVERVIPKYKEFLRHFPNIQALSKAPLGDVLRVWQGLGYNRRAKLLHMCARVLVDNYKGKFPLTHALLMELPGIGHYTAGAIMAFAYNAPIPIIETNIRTVFIHHFFNDEIDVSDRALFQSIGVVLDQNNPREWYWALMDYGWYLKKTVGNQNARSKHYSKQSPFKDSDRQIRGAILRSLSQNASTRKKNSMKLPFDISRIDAQLLRLTEEGMIVKKRNIYQLPS